MWIPIAAWAAAVVIAAVVLGFAGYEIAWKAARLRTAVERVQALSQTAQGMQRELAGAQQRLSRAVVG